MMCNLYTYKLCVFLVIISMILTSLYQNGIFGHLKKTKFDFGFVLAHFNASILHHTHLNALILCIAPS